MTAVNGVNGTGKTVESGWKVGLINFDKKYLTAESFGFKINVSGSGLKKKQTFTLVQDPVEDVHYIKSHMGRYLSSDKYGNVACESEDPGQTEKFVVEYDKNDSQGRVSFRHLVHGNYLGGTEDKLKCFSKTTGCQELWIIQLSIHPQVHLRNVNRKRYAHVCDDQLQATQTIPWADKSLLFLDYVEGRYALKTSDCRYLHTSGELSPELTDTALYTLEIRSGQNNGLAFRDCNGCYLTGVGATATMKGRNRTVTKDELFTLEDTHPQVVLYAHNGKKVSIKQGVDVSANQGDEEGDKEIFQMEFDSHSGKWAFRTVDNKYWSLEPMGGIQAVGKDIRPETLFDVEWQESGSVAIRAKNNSYVYNKPTGSLIAGSESVSEKEQFQLKIVNRSTMVLKADFGFVGSKGTTGKGEICCNRTTYDVIHVEPGTPGLYLLKTHEGKYWSVADDGSITADGSGKSSFQLQVRDNRKLTIRALDNGCFIKGEQNGLFRAVGQQLDASVLWEY